MTSTLDMTWLNSWQPERLSDAASRMANAERTGSWFELDLSDQMIVRSGSPSAARLHLPNVLVLSNLLLGRFRDLQLRVRLPSNKGLNLQLARGALFFALSNRSGAVRWKEEAPELWERISYDWAHPFHPNDVDMYRVALVSHPDITKDSWVVRAAFQRYLLSVVHPHRRRARDLRVDLQKLASRWLSTRFNATQGQELVGVLRDCAEAFYEISVNVPDHAGLGDSINGASLGQVYATLGGGRESYNRLHFSVLDNGVGIPTRVNQKFQDRRRDACTALLDAVEGKLPRRAGGRGIGLRHVYDICRDPNNHRPPDSGAGLRIVTSGDGLGEAAELTWECGDQHPRASVMANVPVEGTLVWMHLGLERRIQPTDEASQLELLPVSTPAVAG